MSDTYWEASYSDGTSLSQYNEDGTINKYTDIDRDKLVKFILYRDDNPIVVLNLDSNKRLIYRKRVAKQLNSGKQEEVYLVGWQERINGKNVQSINFLFEDNHVEVLDGFKEGHQWFDPINFLPEESILEKE